MNKSVLYIVYDRRTHSSGLLKKTYNTHTWISAVGVFGGSVHHLLDHYCYNSVATFMCLIPKEDMESYVKDLRENRKFEYDKLINMLIDISSSNKYFGYEEYLLNQYCLTKHSYINNW